MQSRVNYALVGLFVIGFVIAAVLGGLWLAGGLDGGERDRYSVYVTDSVSGLGRDAQVTYYGVDVGRVTRIELDPRNPRRVHLLLALEPGTPVREGTVAALRMRGLTGLAYIELTGGDLGAPPLTTPPGEQYPVIEYRSSLLMRIDDVLTQGMDTLNTLGARITALLSPGNVAAIERILVNVDNLTAALDEQASRLGATLDRVDALLHDGGTVATEAARTLERARESLAAFNRMSETMTEAGQTLRRAGESGLEGAERVLASTLPEAEALLMQMRAAARELGTLAEQLRREPASLLQGRPAAEPGPGEARP